MNRLARIGDVATVISGYAFKSSEFTQHGVSVVKIANIRDGSVDLSSAQCVNPTYLRHLSKKYVLQGGDILISLTGSHQTQPNSVVGRVARMPKDSPTCLLNQRAGKVIIQDVSACDPDYLYWALRSNRFKDAVISLAHGAASQANVAPKHVESIEIPLPPLRAQRQIAFVLSAYDDLIENNTRRMVILEEMARALYQEWFVRFRFPGHDHVPLVHSPLGPIPEGWECARLGDGLAQLESGSRPKGGVGDHVDGIPSVGAENILGIGRYDYSKDKFVSHQFFEGMNRGKIRDWDVLLYKDGAHIGRKSMFADGFPHLQCCVNEHVFILRTNERLCQSYLYLWLDHPDNEEGVRRTNANAAQPGLNQTGVRGLQIIFPMQETLREFERIVTPMLKMIFNSAKRNSVLRTARDLLLPKLISGETGVSALSEEPIAEAAD